jgi:hypothetical protein
MHRTNLTNTLDIFFGVKYQYRACCVVKGVVCGLPVNHVLVIIHVTIDGMLRGAERRTKSCQSARHLSTNDLPEVIRNLVTDVENQLLIPDCNVLVLYLIRRGAEFENPLPLVINHLIDDSRFHMSGEGNSVTCFSEVSCKKVLEVGAFCHSIESMTTLIFDGFLFYNLGTVNGLDQIFNNIVVLSD